MKDIRQLIIVLIITTTLAMQNAETKSTWQSIPGADLLKDVTTNTFDWLNSAIDGTLNTLSYSVGTDENDDECLECRNDPDIKRNVSELIRSRGFIAEEYDVLTKDGYILTIQRIVNPLLDPSYRRKMKPVIMQHGLMSSSADWVINSQNVRPAKFPADNSNNEVFNHMGESQEQPNSLGFYLANKGYDVYLANSRGNIYGQRSTRYSSWEPVFWNFTFDEQIKYDLPATIEFVQKLSNRKKVAYVGHSQGTSMMFGLLSDRPDYADIIEPFIALAPVAYVSNCLSPAKYFAVYTPVFQNINLWFATSNVAVKYLEPIVCGPKVVRRDVCTNIVFLATGFNMDELDDQRISAYLSHMPSGTSVKNIAHYGQEIRSGRFAHFDHGIAINTKLYGKSNPPDYELSKIRSKSIVLFVADNDWLASPKDVARLRSQLTVEPLAVYNISEYMPKWNHIDFIYGKHAGKLINTRIFNIMEKFKNTD